MSFESELGFHHIFRHWIEQDRDISVEVKLEQPSQRNSRHERVTIQVFFG